MTWGFVIVKCLIYIGIHLDPWWRWLPRPRPRPSDVTCFPISFSSFSYLEREDRNKRVLCWRNNVAWIFHEDACNSCRRYTHLPCLGRMQVVVVIAFLVSVGNGANVALDESGSVSVAFSNGRWQVMLKAKAYCGLVNMFASLCYMHMPNRLNQLSAHSVWEGLEHSAHLPTLFYWNQFLYFFFVNPLPSLKILHDLVDWAENPTVVARASLDNAQQTSGWMYLEVQTRENAEDKIQAKAAGIAEGYLTRQERRLTTTELN